MAVIESFLDACLRITMIYHGDHVYWWQGWDVIPGE